MPEWGTVQGHWHPLMVPSVVLRRGPEGGRSMTPTRPRVTPSRHPPCPSDECHCRPVPCGPWRSIRQDISLNWSGFRMGGTQFVVRDASSARARRCPSGLACRSRVSSRPSRSTETMGAARPSVPVVPYISTVAEAAAALRRLLAAIDAGEIDADDPKARALRRQLEGAAAAWEEVHRADAEGE